MEKLISSQAAAQLVEDRMTLAVGGFGAYAAPETLLRALSDRFDSRRRPWGLTVTCGISPGDNTRGAVGLNRIARPGLLDTLIAAHFANPPLIAELIGANQVAGYALPLGALLHLYRAIASHKPAVVTRVGLNTFADPRLEGCRANQKAADQNRELVELLTLGGEEYLAYKVFPIHICFLRGTYADEDGNISVEEEAVGDYTFQMAAATRNSGGIVVVEVREIVPSGTLPPRQVALHASCVDYVVRSDPALYRQGYAAAFRPELCGSARVRADTLEPLPMGERKIIARRAAMELEPGSLINLGIGIPSGIGSVANEEGLTPTLSLESGPIGGVPVEGLGFGAAVNPEVIYPTPNVFDLYDGGILDMTFLGAAEIDERGNVNVSKFGTRCTGPGGLINISQNTKKVRFLCTFTAGGLREQVRSGVLTIAREGRQKKFVRQVQQVTFSGDYARKTGQDVMYITERAVFRLEESGLVLTELAPGVDLQQDILDQMDFPPAVSPRLKIMDERIFHPRPMGLAAR